MASDRKGFESIVSLKTDGQSPNPKAVTGCGRDGSAAHRKTVRAAKMKTQPSGSPTFWFP